jgi:hypothetical protein
LEGPGGVSVLLLACKAREVQDRESDQEEAHQTSFGDEGEEVEVVATAHAIVEPSAVVIVGLHTTVTIFAVVRPKWAPNFTRIAKLSRNFQCAGMLKTFGITGGW